MANIRSLEGFGYIIRLTIKYNDIGITINLIKENNNKILVLLRQNNKTDSRRSALQYQKHLVSILKSNA